CHSLCFSSTELPYMSTKFPSYRSHLPDSFPWLESLSFNTVTAATKDAIHVVAAISPEDGNGAITIDAQGVGSDLTKQIQEYLTVVQWKPSASAKTIPVHVGGHLFLVVGASKSKKVAVIQRGRQFGLDAGAALRALTPKHVVLVAANAFESIDIFDG